MKKNHYANRNKFRKEIRKATNAGNDEMAQYVNHLLNNPYECKSNIISGKEPINVRTGWMGRH